MDVLIAVAASAALSLLFRNQLARYHAVWYLISALLAALVLVDVFWGVMPRAFVGFRSAVQQGVVPYALCTVVMFIGVFPAKSRARNRFVPIRGTLSVMAFIFLIPHVAIYVSRYFGRIAAGFSNMNELLTISLLLSVVLMVLFALLTVTSLGSVRRHMSNKAWVDIQKFAYPLYILIATHAVLALIPSAMAGGSAAALSLAMYFMLSLAYAMLKCWQLVKDANVEKAEKEAHATSHASDSREGQGSVLVFDGETLGFSQ